MTATWHDTHGDRDLMYRRTVKAMILSRFCDLNGIGGSLGETVDGFHLTADRGRIDFDFPADAGYALFARLANADPAGAAEVAWELRRDMIDESWGADDLDVRWAA